MIEMEGDVVLSSICRENCGCPWVGDGRFLEQNHEYWVHRRVSGCTPVVIGAQFGNLRPSVLGCRGTSQAAGAGGLRLETTADCEENVIRLSDATTASTSPRRDV